MRALVLALILCACRERMDRVALRIDPAEAEAVLAAVGAPGDAGAFERVLETVAYRRLRLRELGMGRRFDDGDMRAFVAAPELAARRAALAQAVAQWSRADVRAIAGRVLPYLPAEARLVATIYPVIKPKPNSFVNHDVLGSAIFVSVDPTRTAAQFENTIAHELHHIGFGSLNDSDAPCAAAPPVCRARVWTGAFAEGFAMLAAAGGPDVHPHRDSPPADRERWDRDVAHVDDDVRTVEAFFREVLDSKLDDDAARARAMQFYGVQGPWYTVGWTMAVAIERCFGRARLVDAMRAPWTVLALYNDAHARCRSGTATATWDPEIVARLAASPSSHM